jgi:hypothetical protein
MKIGMLDTAIDIPSAFAGAEVTQEILVPNRRRRLTAAVAAIRSATNGIVPGLFPAPN